MSDNINININTNNQDENRKRVRIVDRGSLYAKVLFDVEGNPLRDLDTGRYLNVHTKLMQDAFDQGHIRMVHQVMKEPTYHYFLTSDRQEKDFHKYRMRTTKPVFHVYVDDDSRDSDFYHSHFVAPKKE
jgi:hypothetical protein